MGEQDEREKIIGQTLYALAGDKTFVMGMSRKRLAEILRVCVDRPELRDGLLGTMLTAKQVAERLNVIPRRVRALAKSRGVGWQVPGTTQWMFWPEDVERLRPGPPGWRKGRSRKAKDVTDTESDE